MKTAILSLALAILIGALGYYQFERNEKSFFDIQNRLSGLETSLNSLTKLQTEIRPEIAQLEKNLQALKQEENWKLSESAQLLRLAIENLQISRDPKTSLRLLETADNHLNAMHDPKLLPVREKIAQDKAALQALKLPDLDTIWLTLGTLIDTIPNLPSRGIRKVSETPTLEKAAPNTVVKENQTPEKKDNDNDNTPKKEWNRTWQELKDLIKIQRHTTAIEPILPESEQALAKENLRLILEQGRWAILHTNTLIYQRSLQEAIRWLNRYFEASADSVIHMKKSLEDLSKIELRPALPDIGQGLQLLESKG